MTNVGVKMPVKTQRPNVRRPLKGRLGPVEQLRTEVDRLLDDFLRGYWHVPFKRSVIDVEPFWRGEVSFGPTPAVDIIELDDLYKLTAELPGVTEQDIAITFSDDTLMLNVQKGEEKEDEAHDHFLSERHYGTFQRSFRLPNGVDADQVTASLKNGVLMVTLPKTAEARKRQKKIAVKTA